MLGLPRLLLARHCRTFPVSIMSCIFLIAQHHRHQTPLGKFYTRFNNDNFRYCKTAISLCKPRPSIAASGRALANGAAHFSACGTIHIGFPLVSIIHGICVCRPRPAMKKIQAEVAARRRDLCPCNMNLHRTNQQRKLPSPNNSKHIGQFLHSFPTINFQTTNTIGLPVRGGEGVSWPRDQEKHRLRRGLGRTAHAVLHSCLADRGTDLSLCSASVGHFAPADYPSEYLCLRRAVCHGCAKPRI